MAKIAVLMKTHIWSEHLEKFATKIYQETRNHGIDFFILMHDEDGTVKITNPILKELTYTFKEEQIRTLYPVGFYSMWLSNHWMMMWFNLKFGEKYDYIWSIEHDVRISGDSTRIWLHSGKEDFLYVTGNVIRLKNQYRKCYVGGKLEDNQKYQGFLQLSRYSAKFLSHLDRCFTNGENGQDELIIFSVARRDGFSYSCQALHKLVKGVWTWQKKYCGINAFEYNQLERNNKDNKYLAIFHPVK